MANSLNKIRTKIDGVYATYGTKKGNSSGFFAVVNGINDLTNQLNEKNKQHAKAILTTVADAAVTGIDKNVIKQISDLKNLADVLNKNFVTLYEQNQNKRNNNTQSLKQDQDDVVSNQFSAPRSPR